MMSIPARSRSRIASSVASSWAASSQGSARAISMKTQVRKCRTDASGDGLRRFRLGIAHAGDAEDHGLVAEAVEGREIEVGLGSFDRDLLDLRGHELG